MATEQRQGLEGRSVWTGAQIWLWSGDMGADGEREIPSMNRAQMQPSQTPPVARVGCGCDDVFGDWLPRCTFFIRAIIISLTFEGAGGNLLIFPSWDKGLNGNISVKDMKIGSSTHVQRLEADPKILRGFYRYFHIKKVKSSKVYLILTETSEDITNANICYIIQLVTVN